MDNASFLVLFLAITAIMALVPFLLKKFGIPPIISLLIVGMLIGDTGIGINLIPKLTKAVSFLVPKASDDVLKDDSQTCTKKKTQKAQAEKTLEAARREISDLLAATRTAIDEIETDTMERLSLMTATKKTLGSNRAPEGESIIDKIGRHSNDKSSPPNKTAQAFQTFIDNLGALGLMFLMALAGMEADFKLIKTCKKPVILLSLLTFFLPAIGGFFLYRWYHADSLAGQLLYASLFASHSVGIVFPVMRELKLSQTRFGASVLIATIVTDIASILLLAVAVQLKRQDVSLEQIPFGADLSILNHIASSLGDNFIAVFLGIVVLYVVITIFCIHKLGKWIITKITLSEDLVVTLILLFILIAALAGEFLGINFIVGAFIAGLGLSRVVLQQDMLLFRKFENIGYGFLIPFLFVSIGMQTNFRVFKMPGSVSVILMTIIILVGTKIASGYIALRISGFKRRAGLAAGLMTVPQLSATLTAAAIGKNLQIIDEQFFNAIIILSIVTTLPIPNLVRLVIFHRGKPLVTEDVNDFQVPDVVTDSELL